MLRRLQLAPLSLGLSLCAWAAITGCQAEGSSLSGGGYPPVATGGVPGSTNNTLPSATGGNPSSSTGGTSSGQSTAQGGNTSQGGTSATSSNTSKGGSATGGTSSGTTSSSTGGNKPTGGSSSSSSTGGSTSSSSTATGGATGSTNTATGGATTITTATSTVAQTCTDDLMTLASGDKNNWVVNTSGKSCGVQGAFYAYDDGKTITTPAKTTGTDKETPCVKDGTKVKCCIKGETTATAADWGGGLGIDLNSSGGTTATKGAYSGAAKGFKFTLAGTFGASMKLRIMYQSTTTSQTTDPFKEVAGAAGDFSVLFADVKCPTDWGASATCTAASTTPYAFKIQVVGGAAAAAFDFCLTSMTPL